MANTDPTSVHLPLEVRADITLLIAEIRVAADAARLGLEAANQLLGRPGELASVFAHLKALADGTAELTSRWLDLLTQIDTAKGEAGQ